MTADDDVAGGGGGSVAAALPAAGVREAERRYGRTCNCSWNGSRLDTLTSRAYGVPSRLVRVGAGAGAGPSDIPGRLRAQS